MAENNLYFKDTPLVHAPFWAGNGSCPVEEVVLGGGETDGAEILLLDVRNLAVYALEGGLWAESSASKDDRAGSGLTEEGFGGGMAGGREKETGLVRAVADGETGRRVSEPLGVCSYVSRTCRAEARSCFCFRF